MERYKEYKRNSKKRNYAIGRIGSVRHKWTEEEIELMLETKLTDRELSKIIQHSVGAIQAKRHKLKMEVNNEQGSFNGKINKRPRN